MTFLKRLAVIPVLCTILLMGISMVPFDAVASNSAYAAEPLDINAAEPDELKALPDPIALLAFLRAVPNALPRKGQP